MAGAGYKLFNTGDVLTAAQVNTYLMEQTVMVFADAAARTAALSGVVSEGMISYLKDTNAVEVYNGSAWVASDDPNAIQNTIVDAKGDLITATAADTPARLAVGNNGETLVADSSASTGLRWQGNFAAGKNKIINGDFNVNQRAFSSTTASGYTFDRWNANLAGDGTATYTAQTFTAGAAPVAGYEATNFLQIATTGQTTTAVRTFTEQRIEDVRTFAGQTITVSFWAKAASGTPSVAVDVLQNFGSGGSASVGVAGQKVAITTSWARYSFTYSVPSISGKTLGAGSYLSIRLWTSAGSNFNTETNTLGIQTATIGLWGIQAEAGNLATAFQTATGTLAGELAACQRYYWRNTSPAGGFLGMYPGIQTSTTAAAITVIHPVAMRVAPTSIDSASLNIEGGNFNGVITSLTIDTAGVQTTSLTAGFGAVGAANNAVRIRSTGGVAGYVGLSAEL